VRVPGERFGINRSLFLVRRAASHQTPRVPSGYPTHRLESRLLAVSAIGDPRSGRRVLAPQPNGGFVHHGGEPLGRICPLFVDALGLGGESGDLGA
jgi:hypothetical protein